MPLKRANIDGHARFITFSCFRRQNFLKSGRACQWFADSLLEAKSLYSFSLWAYVIMPNHVHLLILPRQGKDASKLLAHAKVSTTHRCFAWLREHNPAGLPRMADAQPNGKIAYRFWQRGGGYDRNLLSPEQVHEKTQYIHQNPVRAGLVKLPGDWHWSSDADWQEGRNGPIAIDREDFPALKC